MIALKSAREIEIMRRSGKITAKTLAMLIREACPGITTRRLDQLAEKSIRALGGVPTFKGYQGFPASICASVNDQVVHGIPGERTLQEGDLLSIDIGTTLEGYVSDSAVTIAIGEISAAAEQLLRITQECLMLGIAQMQGVTIWATSVMRSKRTRKPTATASCAIWSVTASAGACTRSLRCPITGSRDAG